MDVKETVRNPLEIEAPDVPPQLRALLEPGEHVIELEPKGAVCARIHAAGLAFRCFGFSEPFPQDPHPLPYWYEIGGEEGGPMKLSTAAAQRLRALLASVVMEGVMAVERDAPAQAGFTLDALRMFLHNAGPGDVRVVLVTNAGRARVGSIGFPGGKFSCTEVRLIANEPAPEGI